MLIGPDVQLGSAVLLAPPTAWPAAITNAWIVTAASVSKTGTDITSIAADKGAVALTAIGAPQWEAGSETALFDGTDDAARADAAVSSTSGTDQPFTIGMTIQQVANTTGRKYWCLGYSANGQSRFWLDVHGSGIEFTHRDDANTETEDVLGEDETLEAAGVHTLIALFNGTSGEIYIDGVEVSTYSPDQALDIGAATTLDRLTFFAERRNGVGDAANNFMNARIRALAFADGAALSSGDVASLHAKLNSYAWTP